MTVNNERSSRNSSHRKLGLSEGMSVRPIEHRNRNSIPGAYTHALAFKGGFQDDARRREARVKPQTEKTFRATRRGEEMRLFCVITIISRPRRRFASFNSRFPRRESSPEYRVYAMESRTRTHVCYRYRELIITRAHRESPPNYNSTTNDP